MKKLAIGEVQPGETVARAVTTSNGIVLVQPGTALTAELLARLVTLGVDYLWLEGAVPGAPPIEQLLANLDRRFAGHEATPLMMQLKEIVASRIRLDMGGGADVG